MIPVKRHSWSSPDRAPRPLRPCGSSLEVWSTTFATSPRSRRDPVPASWRRSRPSSGCCNGRKRRCWSCGQSTRSPPRFAAAPTGRVIGGFSAMQASRPDLRLLRHDRIRHPILRVAAICRRHPATSSQVDDQAVGHVALGQSDICAWVRRHHVKPGLACDCWIRASATPGCAEARAQLLHKRSPR